MAPKKVKKVHRECENDGCRVISEYYPRDIARGKGLFCCKICGNANKRKPVYEKICKICESPFKTTNYNARCCCIECDTEDERIYEMSIRSPKQKQNA